MGERERSLIYELSKTARRRMPLLPGIEGTVSAVDQVLATGETPCAVAWGRFENGRWGLLLATDLRLISLDKGGLTRTVNVHDIPYDMVKAINHKLGWACGKITILTFPSGGIQIGGVENRDVSTFSDLVRARIGVAAGATGMGRGEHSTTASLSVGPRSLADELTKLAALRDSGVLSEAEFLETKKRLLSR